jgi:cyclase
MQPLPTLDRRNFLAILSAAAGTAALTTPALANLIRNPADPQLLFPWDELKPGFHAFADINTGGNTLIAVSKDQALLIDTKFAHLAGALRADAQSLAGKDAALTLINTHHHGDHTGGNALIVPHATTYAHTNAIDRIKSQLDRYKQGAKSAPERIKDSPFNSETTRALAAQAADASATWTQSDITPQHSVADQQTLTLADTTLTMHHFGPGHTDNDLVIHFPDHNIIHTGDLVFNNLHPFFDPSANATALGWTKSLKSILKLCDKHTTIIPGHGQIGTTQIVQSQLEYLEQLITHVQADIDAAVPKSESAEKTWDFMQNIGFESIRSRAIEATYDELSK